MFNFIADFFKEFIPDKNLPTPAYLARLSVIFLMTVTVAVMIYLGALNTAVGDRWGINRKTPQYAEITHYEFNRSERQNWEIMTQLRENDENIRGVFIALLIDIRTGNVIRVDERKASSVIIWNFSIPGRRFNSLEVIENALNKVKPTFQERFNNTRECYSDRLTGEPLNILRRGIQNLQSTHFSACPIFARKGGYTLGSTIILYKLEEDPLSGVKPKDEKQYPDYEVLTMLAYQDRLQRATGLMKDKLEDFSRPYIIYYR